MAKSLKSEIEQLIKDDFHKEDIKITNLKVSFAVTESTETLYHLEDDTEQKPRGPKPGKKRGPKKGSKHKTKTEKVDPDVIPSAGAE